MNKTLSFLKKYRSSFLFLIILSLGTFFRFYKIEQNLVFHGELGDNYLAIKNFIASGKIPLIGPPTSHPWLSFGPLFYWIFAPVLVAFKYEPIAGAYFFAFVGSLVIFLNYYFIKRIFNLRVALISSFLIAISPAFIDLTRESRFFSLVVPFFYPFIYFLFKLYQGEKKYLFWLGLIFGAMLNFHYSPLILFPSIVVVLSKMRKQLNGNDLIKLTIGFLLPNLPFLIYNLQTNFEMLKKFLTWIPYRVLGFTGLIPQNSLTFGSILSNFMSLNFFVSDLFLPFLSVLSLVVSLVFLLSILYLFKNHKNNIALMTLISLMFVGYIILFIHGLPPTHYYLPLYPIPIVIFSFVLEKLSLKITLVLLFAIFLSSFRFYFSDKWFNKYQTTEPAPLLVSYISQVNVSKEISRDAKDQEFSLKRVGYYDHFEENYSQNYRYLLWLNGNEPKDRRKLLYTIYEQGFGWEVTKPYFEVDGVKVTKELYE